MNAQENLEEFQERVRMWHAAGFSTAQKFSSELVAFYDALCEEGLSVEVGHVLYHLSRHLSIEEREQVLVYPSEEGGWHTLEDWRAEWLRLHKGEVPPVQQLALGELTKATEE